MKYDVIIIGAGILGLTTAYYLSRLGKKVIVVEQFTVQNNLNTSYDATRILKFAHGGDELKTQMAIESLALYKEIEKISGVQIFFPCPAFFPGKTQQTIPQNKNSSLAKTIQAKYIGSDANDHHVATVNLLEKRNVSCRLVTKKSIEKLYPQFVSEFGMIDENAGILEASTAVDIFASLVRQQGVLIKEQTKITKITKNSVMCENGEEIQAEKIVVTAGVYVGKLLGDSFPILPIKKEIVYLQPKNPKQFSKEKFPLFLDINTGFYGLPMHKGNGVKIGNHYIGDVVNPDTVQRTVSKEFIALVRGYINEFIPELHDAKIIKTKVCLYEMTPDEEFIIDRIKKNIFVATGAGHAFKFAPLLGQTLAERVVHGKSKYALPRFTLKRFSERSKHE